RNRGRTSSGIGAWSLVRGKRGDEKGTASSLSRRTIAACEKTRRIARKCAVAPLQNAKSLRPTWPQALCLFLPSPLCTGERGGELPTRQVAFEIGKVHFALFFVRGRIEDVLPAALPAVLPTRMRFQVALAADAQCRVGQSVEPAHRNLALADFAQAVSALLEPRQGTVDLRQFTRVQLGQVRVHLVAAGLEGRVGAVAAAVAVL